MKTGYFIKRRSGNNFIVSPFQNPRKAENWDMMESFSWMVGNTLETGELDNLDSTTFHQIDRGIDRWIQDAKYFPRLFLSAAAFIVVYFALSFAVRDPIPLIDEFIAGFAAAAAVWFYMDKRAIKSDASVKRRLELKQRVSDAELKIDQNIVDLENWLDEVGSYNLLELTDAIVRCNSTDLPEINALPGNDFCSLLEEYCQMTIPRLVKLLPQVQEARRDTDPNVKLAGFLVESGQSNLENLIRLAFLVAVKEKN